MHGKLTISIAFLLLVSPFAIAEDAEETQAPDVEAATEADDRADESSSGPRKMSGMSVLGNEEAPKSLVIIPWKSSELGDDISLSDTLDDRARPVDKEVFMRELSFYEIRSSE
jgi:hypothetical protein